MLNKELLLATKDQMAGPIKLTVEKAVGGEAYGYTNAEGYETGSLSKVPCWDSAGKSVALRDLFAFKNFTTLVFNFTKVDPTKITMTVVEKGLTVTFILTTGFVPSYDVQKSIFNSSDVGKTYTIVFDPEPTGYV